jgi:hypothetical protein
MNREEEKEETEEKLITQLRSDEQVTRIELKA